MIAYLTKQNDENVSKNTGKYSKYIEINPYRTNVENRVSS